MRCAGLARTCRTGRVRRPRRVYDKGGEPDPRFTLANERTLLAWLRTSIALAIAGVGIVAISDLVEPAWLVEVFAVTAFAGGAATAALGYLHWQRVEAAMRQGQPLPAPTALLAVLATIVAVVLFGGLALLDVGS